MISSRESRDLNPDPLVSRAPASKQKDPESRTPGTAGTLPSAPFSPPQRAGLCEQGSVAKVGARLEAPFLITQASASKLLQIMGLFAQETEEAVNSRQSN